MLIPAGSRIYRYSRDVHERDMWRQRIGERTRGRMNSMEKGTLVRQQYGNQETVTTSVWLGQVCLWE